MGATGGRKSTGSGRSVRRRALAWGLPVLALAAAVVWSVVHQRPLQGPVSVQVIMSAGGASAVTPTPGSAPVFPATTTTTPAPALAATPAPTDQTSPPPDPTSSAPGTEVPAGIDESDPFLTVAGGSYVLVTSGDPTGGVAGAPVDVPLSTSLDFVHWTTPVDALPELPAWAQPGYTWAPDLHRFGSTYALYFTALVANQSPPTECIGSAFSSSPTGPFVASPTPFICQMALGGSIDPRVFVDRDGTPWILFKSDENIGGSTTPTIIWSQRLSADGTRLLGSPTPLLSPDRGWQGSIVEAPDMVTVGGNYWLVYSANWYNSPDYAIGAARCAGPAGPCGDIAPAPLLASNYQGAGPGEASLYQDADGIWMLYSPRRSLAPAPDVPARPVYITRLGFSPLGVYLAQGPLPGAFDLLDRGLWAPSP